MEEIWKDIKGYEGRYQISNYGNIKSLKRNGCSGGMIKTEKRHGYLRVRLWKESTVKNYSIHKLVAISFLPNYDNKPFINHKDGNKENNFVGNLEWCSQKENMVHAYENGLIKTRKVMQIKDGKVIKTFTNMRRASLETGIQYSSIYWCANGIYKKAGGYEWRYETPFNNK